jgi:hypothetical protein
MVGREYAIPTVRRHDAGPYGPGANSRVARWVAAG